MEPLNPRRIEAEVRTLLSAADRATLSAAGLIVVPREPLLLLIDRLEEIADIVSQYPNSHQAARLRPEVQNALYLTILLVETR